MDLEESFDPHKLNHIIQNEAFYRSQMRSKCFDDGYKPFTICKKYLDLSQEGTIKTSYRQNESFGRFYACGSLSLQNIPREVRHTIASHLYQDVDIKNAHPVILAFLCKQRKIPCPLLDEYITNRDEKLALISPDKEIGKTVILSTLNGGVSAMNELEDPPYWLCMFKTETDHIHSQFAKDPEYKSFKKKKQARGNTYNFKAKYMNGFLCDMENKILMTMHQAIGSPRNCVLCFDGIMICKTFTVELKKIEEAVFKEVGIHIQLAFKEMNEGFKDEGILNCTPYIPPTVPNTFDFLDKKDYRTFHNNYVEYIFGSYEVMYQRIKEESPAVIVRILHGEGLFIKKDPTGFHVTKNLKLSDLELRYYHTDGSVKKLFLSKALCRLQGFGNIVCSLTNCSKDDFNTWTGFQAQRVVPQPENQDGVEMMKSFIMDVWANKDVISYNYIISWFAGLVTNLTGINRVALAMVSKQGYGKNTLYEFMEFILRKRNMISVTGIEQVTGKFNRCLENKRLVNVNEMSSVGSQWLANFDKIKANITDTTITIEPKGVDTYETNNIGNYILFTNHRDAIRVEASDRRYAIFEMGTTLKDAQYFTDLRETCFNQTIADEFYTFLLDFKAVPLGVIPMTPLRFEMMQLSKNSAMKFLDALPFLDCMYKWAPDGARGVALKKMPALDLYGHYKNWCEKNGEKHVQSMSKFGCNIGDTLKKSRTEKGFSYELPSLCENVTETE